MIGLPLASMPLTTPTWPARHHRDGAHLRAGNPRAVTRIAPGEIAAPGVAGALEHQVQEGAAPQAAPPGRVGADIFARLRNQRVTGNAAIGGVRMRLRGDKACIRFRAQPRVARDPRLPAATVAAASRGRLVGGFLGRVKRITHVTIGAMLPLRRGLRDHRRMVPMVMDGSGDGRTLQKLRPPRNKTISSPVSG